MEIFDVAVIVDKVIVVPEHFIGQAIVIRDHPDEDDKDNADPAFGGDVFF